MPSPIPWSLVIHECLWKNPDKEKKGHGGVAPHPKNFFKNPPIKTDALHGVPLPVKNEAPIWKTTLPPLKSEAPFQETIPRKNKINNNLISS